MSESETQKRTKELVFAYQLDAPPEKVWLLVST